MLCIFLWKTSHMSKLICVVLCMKQPVGEIYDNRRWWASGIVCEMYIILGTYCPQSKGPCKPICLHFHMTETSATSICLLATSACGSQLIIGMQCWFFYPPVTFLLGERWSHGKISKLCQWQTASTSPVHQLGLPLNTFCRTSLVLLTSSRIWQMHPSFLFTLYSSPSCRIPVKTSCCLPLQSSLKHPLLPSAP